MEVAYLEKPETLSDVFELLNQSSTQAYLSFTEGLGQMLILISPFSILHGTNSLKGQMGLWPMHQVSQCI